MARTCFATCFRYADRFAARTSDNSKLGCLLFNVTLWCLLFNLKLRCLRFNLILRCLLFNLKLRCLLFNLTLWCLLFNFFNTFQLFQQNFFFFKIFRHFFNLRCQITIYGFKLHIWFQIRVQDSKSFKMMCRLAHLEGKLKKKFFSKNGVKLQFKVSNYIFDPKFAFTTQKAFKWCADWPI